MDESMLILNGNDGERLDVRPPSKAVRFFFLSEVFQSGFVAEQEENTVRMGIVPVDDVLHGEMI